MNFTLVVPFSATPTGLAEIDYAVSLARLLGKDPPVQVRVRVHVMTEAYPQKAMEKCLGKDVHNEEYKRIVAFLRTRFDRDARDLLIQIDEPTNKIELRQEPGTFIVNGGTTALIFAPFPLFITKGESAFNGRGPAKVLVPLGDSDSGLHALQESLPLIVALKCGIVFYHTTWKKPNLFRSTNPADHICTAAAIILRDAQNIVSASIAEPKTETVIECADGVAEGIRRAGNRLGCNLIIMARGSRAGAGSYADELAHESPIPVLYFGRQGVKR